MRASCGSPRSSQRIGDPWVPGRRGVADEVRRRPRPVDRPATEGAVGRQRGAMSFSSVQASRSSPYVELRVDRFIVENSCLAVPKVGDLYRQTLVLPVGAGGLGAAPGLGSITYVPPRTEIRGGAASQAVSGPASIKGKERGRQQMISVIHARLSEAVPGASRSSSPTPVQHRRHTARENTARTTAPPEPGRPRVHPERPRRDLGPPLRQLRNRAVASGAAGAR